MYVHAVLFISRASHAWIVQQVFSTWMNVWICRCVDRETKLVSIFPTEAWAANDSPFEISHF